MTGAGGVASGEGVAGCGSWIVPSFTAGWSTPDPAAAQGERMRSAASRNAVFIEWVPFPGDVAISGGILPEKAHQYKPNFNVQPGKILARRPRNRKISPAACPSLMID